jgi:hypothetical protein
MSRTEVIETTMTRGPPGTVDYIGLHPVIPARRVARTGTVAAAPAAGEGTRRSESGALTVTAPDAKVDSLFARDRFQQFTMPPLGGFLVLPAAA